MDGMKHRSASCRFTQSVLPGFVELTHLKAKKPGRGDGSELMRRAIAHFDSKKQPLALTAEPELTGFYARFGFEAIQEKPLIMVRLCKSQAKP